MPTHKLKLDEQGAVVVQDGKPVYLAEDGKEIIVDYDGTIATIARLNGEAKGHREDKEAALGKLKAFEGIEDPVKAIRALETLKNLDDKKLVEAGEVERIKKEAVTAYEEKLRAIDEKYKPVITERDTFREELHREIIGGVFSRSKYIADKLAIPGDLVQSKFGSHFSIGEDKKIIAKDASGNQIYSRANPGNVADFDEALQTIVEAYPYRDSILKGSGASGGGAGGSGGGAGGKRTITRAAFDAMSPTDQVATAKSAKAGDVNIVD